MTPSKDLAPTTILVVEQNLLLLKLVKLILEEAGFEVLAAASAKNAMLVEVGFPRTIHLLLSSLTIHGTTGPELARAMKERRPEMRVMFMSGYPDGALLVLNYGWHFISKPFVPGILVTKIQDLLTSTILEQAVDRFDTRELGPQN